MRVDFVLTIGYVQKKHSYIWLTLVTEPALPMEGDENILMIQGKPEGSLAKIFNFRINSINLEVTQTLWFKNNNFKNSSCLIVYVNLI